jgi:hypothetical protein
MLKDGRTLVGGPDHYARLTAAKHLREFLLAGRPLSKKEDRSKRLFTLEGNPGRSCSESGRETCARTATLNAANGGDRFLCRVSMSRASRLSKASDFTTATRRQRFSPRWPPSPLRTSPCRLSVSDARDNRVGPLLRGEKGIPRASANCCGCSRNQLFC